jgi:RHS repeat-associated protein
VYDGLLILQERDSNNIPVLTYTRGLDLSSSLQGAGGIGGLLALSDQRASATSPTNYFYHSDGNGNIVALLNYQNEVVARYLYDPFGNLLAMSGPTAPFNRQRFSSKEWHSQSGLLLYEFRAYDPNLQRWLTQDPIGEAGGINLYRFVSNDPANRVDPLGESDFNRPPAIVIQNPGGNTEVRYGPPTPDPRITVGDIDGRTFVDLRDFTRDLLSAASEATYTILFPEELRELHQRLDPPAHPDMKTGYPPMFRPGLKPCPPRYPRDFQNKHTVQRSAQFGSEAEARALARQKVGSNPVDVGDNKLRSRDGRWQYRAKAGDVNDNHVHLERLDPGTGTVLENWHLEFPETKKR